MTQALTQNDLLQKLKDIELALNESSIVSITNQRGTIQFVNERFCRVSKYTKEELLGHNQNIVNSGYHSKDFFKDMWRTIGTGNVWKGEIRNEAKDGAYYWVDTTIVPFLNKKGKPRQYISIRHDITKRKAQEDTIKEMAFYDRLTSLPNHYWLREWIDDHPTQVGETITALFLGIDRFKGINDTYGRDTGDIVLKSAAKRLKNSVNEQDFIVRQESDEFIVVLHQIDDKQDIMNVIGRIKEQFALPMMISDQQFTITASIGISMNSIEDKKDTIQDVVETTIKQADTSMHHVKMNGGNSHCFNTDDQNLAMKRYYELHAEIKHALEEDEFSVVYQPLIHLKDNQISGVEALLRWKNPTLGSISPVEFIPILEEVGLIIPVGKWVLRAVCNQINRWEEKGLEIDRVCVNVSPIQFRNHDFIKDVQEVLYETGVKATKLEIEITEGTILNIENPGKTLHQLKDLGVSISIDDFGTGYSSLSYLKRLPVNTLKIDKSFIDELDIEGEVIVDTIISMGKSLQFNVVAEGIETKAQAVYLKEQKCHEGQGYYWSKPLQAKQIMKLYNELKNESF